MADATLGRVGDSPAGFPRGGPWSGTALLLWASAALAAAAAALLLTDHRLAAGLAALGSGAGLVGATTLAWPGTGSRATFAANVLDRTYDASLLGPLAWISRTSAPRVSAVALLGLGAAFTSSYERAKAVSLGYRASEGIVYRGVRAALLVAGLLTGLVEAALWAFAALTVAASGVRAMNVAAQHASERKSGPAGSVRGA